MEIKLPTNLTSEAQTFMDAVIEKLENAGALENCDCGSLWMLANSYNNLVKAANIVAEEGLMIVGTRGSYVEHPAAGLMNKFSAQVLAIMKDLGATVKSREHIKKLSPDNVADDSPINQFL